MSVVDPETGALLLGEPHHDGSDLCVLERPDELGGDATLRLRTRRGTADHVLLRAVCDGEPRTITAEIDEETDGETGGTTWWRATLPVVNPATRYRWLLTGGETGYAWVNGLGSFPHEVPTADDFVLNAGPGGPDWHLDAVIYEIFPDRFARSGAERVPPAWAIPRDWSQPPTGRGKATPYEWYGGDLAGIEQRLDHVASLGATAIYLTPVFPAGSTHRYDAWSFDRVDPLLGGDEALASLARAARARGIRLIGDLTLNHTGRGHDWFRTADTDPASVERGFYTFDEAHPHGYASWLGVASLPKLDWRSEELRRRMTGVAGRWLERGLDAWRIDVANMTGRLGAVDLNHEVARLTRQAAGGALVVAEHGSDYRPDLDGTGWHGAMNYAGFLRPAWWWLRGEQVEADVFSAAPAPHYTGAEAVAVMRRYRAGLPWDAVLHSWTLLDSHDSPRFSHVAASRAHVHVGIGLQMTTPGVPMVFAGDELGVGGAWGEDARRPMPWDAPETWDVETLGVYRALAALRRSHPALARGGLRYLHVSDDAIAYLRETRGERLLCLAARADHTPIPNPFPRLETLYGEDAGETLPASGPSFHLWRIGDSLPGDR